MDTALTPRTPGNQSRRFPHTHGAWDKARHEYGPPSARGALRAVSIASLSPQTLSAQKA
jgi:hypothetical protein